MSISLQNVIQWVYDALPENQDGIKLTVTAAGTLNSHQSTFYGQEINIVVVNYDDPAMNHFDLDEVNAKLLKIDLQLKEVESNNSRYSFYTADRSNVVK